jgi:hypothetical protein
VALEGSFDPPFRKYYAGILKSDPEFSWLRIHIRGSASKLINWSKAWRIAMCKKISKGKRWAVLAIMLGVALVLTAWLPTDLSAKGGGGGSGNKAHNVNSAIRQIPGNPDTVLNPNPLPIKGAGGSQVRTGKGAKGVISGPGDEGPE